MRSTMKATDSQGATKRSQKTYKVSSQYKLSMQDSQVDIRQDILMKNMEQFREKSRYERVENYIKFQNNFFSIIDSDANEKQTSAMNMNDVRNSIFAKQRMRNRRNRIQSAKPGNFSTISTNLDRSQALNNLAHNKYNLNQASLNQPNKANADLPTPRIVSQGFAAQGVGQNQTFDSQNAFSSSSDIKGALKKATNVQIKRRFMKSNHQLQQYTTVSTPRTKPQTATYRTGQNHNLFNKKSSQNVSSVSGHPDALTTALSPKSSMQKYSQVLSGNTNKVQFSPASRHQSNLSPTSGGGKSQQNVLSKSRRIEESHSASTFNNGRSQQMDDANKITKAVNQGINTRYIKRPSQKELLWKSLVKGKSHGACHKDGGSPTRKTPEALDEHCEEEDKADVDRQAQLQQQIRQQDALLAVKSSNLRKEILIVNFDVNNLIYQKFRQDTIEKVNYITIQEGSKEVLTKVSLQHGSHIHLVHSTSTNIELIPNNNQYAVIDIEYVITDGKSHSHYLLPSKMQVCIHPESVNQNLVLDLKILMSMNNKNPGRDVTNYNKACRTDQIIFDQNFHIKQLVDGQTVTVGPFGDQKLRKFQKYPDHIYIGIIQNSDQLIFPKIKMTPYLIIETHSEAEHLQCDEDENDPYSRMDPILVEKKLTNYYEKEMEVARKAKVAKLRKLNEMRRKQVGDMYDYFQQKLCPQEPQTTKHSRGGATFITLQPEPEMDYKIDSLNFLTKGNIIRRVQGRQNQMIRDFRRKSMKDLGRWDEFRRLKEEAICKYKDIMMNMKRAKVLIQMIKMHQFKPQIGVTMKGKVKKAQVNIMRMKIGINLKLYNKRQWRKYGGLQYKYVNQIRDVFSLNTFMHHKYVVYQSKDTFLHYLTGRYNFLIWKKRQKLTILASAQMYTNLLLIKAKKLNRLTVLAGIAYNEATYLQKFYSQEDLIESRRKKRHIRYDTQQKAIVKIFNLICSQPGVCHFQSDLNNSSFKRSYANKQPEVKCGKHKKHYEDYKQFDVEITEICGKYMERNMMKHMLYFSQWMNKDAKWRQSIYRGLLSILVRQLEDPNQNLELLCRKIEKSQNKRNQNMYLNSKNGLYGVVTGNLQLMQKKYEKSEREMDFFMNMTQPDHMPTEHCEKKNSYGPVTEHTEYSDCDSSFSSSRKSSKSDAASSASSLKTEKPLSEAAVEDILKTENTKNDAKPKANAEVDILNIAVNSEKQHQNLLQKQKKLKNDCQKLKELQMKIMQNIRDIQFQYKLQTARVQLSDDRIKYFEKKYNDLEYFLFQSFLGQRIVDADRTFDEDKYRKLNVPEQRRNIQKNIKMTIMDVFLVQNVMKNESDDEEEEIVEEEAPPKKKKPSKGKNGKRSPGRSNSKAQKLKSTKTLMLKKMNTTLTSPASPELNTTEPTVIPEERKDPPLMHQNEQRSASRTQFAIRERPNSMVSRDKSSKMSSELNRRQRSSMLKFMKTEKVDYRRAIRKLFNQLKLFQHDDSNLSIYQKIKAKNKPKLQDNVIEILTQLNFEQSHLMEEREHFAVETLSQNLQELIMLYIKWGEDCKTYIEEPGKAKSILNKVMEAGRGGKARDRLTFRPQRFSMFAFRCEKQDIHKMIFKAAKISDEAIEKVKREIQREEEKALEKEQIAQAMQQLKV